MYRIGIDFGGTNIAAGIVNEEGKICYKRSLPTRKGERPVDDMVRDMATLCFALAQDAGVPLSQVRSVGVASPGVVNSQTGQVEFYAGMQLDHYPMAEKLRRELGCEIPVHMANDANAAALGEALAGAAKGAKSALMITLGTGVGGGIILDGKIFEGCNYAAAEMGHVVIEKDGVLCACGRRGCWEQYSSATALIRMTKEEMERSPDSAMHELCPDPANVDGRTAYTAAKRGDEAAGRVVERYHDYLATGLANMVNIFQPEALLIGGGVCGEGDYLMKPVTELVMQRQYARTSAKKTRIAAAALGNDAGIVGAAMLGAE